MEVKDCISLPWYVYSGHAFTNKTEKFILKRLDVTSSRGVISIQRRILIIEEAMEIL